MPSFYFNYTSKFRFKCINTFINDFLRNFIPLFNNVFQGSQISYFLPLVYILLKEFLILKIYWIQIWIIRWLVMELIRGSFFLSFNLLGVSLTMWALAQHCMNKYSLCFTSLFISEILFLDSTLLQYFAFTFVFDSTIEVLPAFGITIKTIIWFGKISIS